MNQNKVKIFDFSTFSFQGISLIEASAGAGKTYIVAMLYLRLLLLGTDGYHHLHRLTIENILVVTFTRAAAEELRERIRKNIREFRSICIVGYSDNIFFSELLKKIHDTNLAYKQLLEAEQKIDIAQIFTIHSFCQRVLNSYPLELNIPLKYKFLEDETVLFKQACDDFWRRYFYPLPIEIIKVIKKYWKNPTSLFNEIHPYLYNTEINVLPFLKGNILKQHEHIINYINYTKKTWNNEKSNLLKSIAELSLNPRIYNKKNLKIWFKNINVWANEKARTKDYNIPKELQRFRYFSVINNSNSEKINKMPQFLLLKIIEILFKTISSLKQLILNIAIHEVRKIVKNTKKFSLEIGFNDLIYLLDSSLCYPKTGERLARLISFNYPVTIIDEFQDTDLQQYRIFHTLYSLSKSKYKLLLVADPKQSIYSFRGADIFSYLTARKHVDFLYTLNINWRSSPSMVNAINTLFQFNSSVPFIFQGIHFTPMHFAKINKKLHLIVKNKIYPAMYFCLPLCDQLTLDQYRTIIGHQCAYIIQDLLNNINQKTVWLQDENSKRLLRPSDIVILVRDRNEGCLISSILEKMNIASVYLSTRENIFKTEEAVDLLYILQAVLAPEDSNKLRCALITSFIGYNAKKIDFINQNKDDWEKEVEQFTNYYLIWEQHGIQPMLQEIIFRRNILIQDLTYSQQGERYLINVLHIGEILQKKSLELSNKGSLVSWLNMKINSSTIYSDDQVSRLKFGNQIIKIITIHKAKGLEFPLVFLPFIPDIRSKKYPMFHDRENYKIFLDLDNLPKNFDLSEEERLSEDLRLFYVAVTRAIYYCFIGIGSIYFKKMSTQNINDLHRTALGYLIQNAIPGNFQFLKQCLKKLIKCADGDIKVGIIPIFDNQCCQLLVDNNLDNKKIIKYETLSARDWNISINLAYKITSYTELHSFSKCCSSLTSNLNLNGIFNQNNSNFDKNNDRSLTSHTFPRGSVIGNFLHDIFRKWNFREKISDDWLIIQLNRNGINIIWLPFLQKWIKMIVSTPLDNKDLMLSNLLSVNYSTEFQFYLSIKNFVSAKKFDAISKDYDPISRLSTALTFPNIIGMLHGFIDLVFFWQGKYYLLDYKSNWLGDTDSSYIFSCIKREMVTHHYALQYQIYTLALHRFLRHKLSKYDYVKDFGGVYYLFLRGMNLTHPGNGIYFCRPNQMLIDKLDKLLSS